MDQFIQICTLVTALGYKIFLAQKSHFAKTIGWYTELLCSAFSIAYVIWYMYRPILLIFEIMYAVFAIYGTYKHTQRRDEFNKTDKSILMITAVSILCIAYGQLQTHAVWFQIIGSASFLAGVALMAQKEFVLCQLFAWICFISGAVCMINVYSEKPGIIALHYISIGIDCVAIVGILLTLRKKNRKNKRLNALP